MIREKFMYKHYKTIMGILILVGVSLILLSNLNAEMFEKGYTAGIGVGLIFGGVINFVIITIKKRNSDYEEEMELAFQDERVQLNKMKAMAYAGLFAIAELIIFSMLNVYFNFNLTIGISIVLLSYSAVVAFFKFYLRNK